MNTEPQPLLPPPLIGHVNASLYADLDSVALQLAFAAYGRAYEGSWPRALVAAIRVYLKEADRPTYAATADSGERS